ncbi:protein SON isoform X2 [Rhinoderma darwinii]|uniref:protein SON isoform X2 n=1 Tax=Rhinoderma darwinii TaxID=43563 RepID=UPI003F672DDE
MATNIEQIFRSFVVNKFKEIEEENRNSENMDSSHNGESTAPGTEDASEASTVITQNEESSQTVTKTEDTESKPMEVVNPQNLAVERESGSKDLKSTDLSSDDEVKKDSSKKKSKKHKKHKSKKKKKKKKKEKNEKRSKSTSSVEDQENASPESKSVWKPVLSSPREQDKLISLSSQMEENVDPLPSLSVQDYNVDSVKEHPATSQVHLDFGFFGPKCPNEMHFSASSIDLPVCEAEMPETSKELAIDCQEKNEHMKCTDQNNEKPLTNCETAPALQNEVSLPQPGVVLSEGISVELGESRLNPEGNEDLKQSDDITSLLLQQQSKSASVSLSKFTTKSRSRSNSLARDRKSRSKSLTKLPKKPANTKSLTRPRSRSTSVVRRQRSRSSSIGRRRRSKSKSPVRRRRSRSSTSARYSKSPIRSWWSKSIKNRQRSVSIERKRRSRTRSPAKRRNSRSRSSEKGHYSRTKSSGKRIGSRSRSANRRRKSRSTSRKRRLHSRSASRRKSKSPSKTSSHSRKRKSKSASPLRRQTSRTSSAVRRCRSRSRSAVLKRRSRSGAASRRQRSGSGSRRRKSRSGSFTRRSRSGSAPRRGRSRSGLAFRRRRSRSAVATRRRRSRSPSAPRRRRSRSPSATRRRRSRSFSAPRRRRSRSPSVIRRRRSRSPSAPRRRRSRSTSRRRRSRSDSVFRRRRMRSDSRRRKSRTGSDTRKPRSRSGSYTRRHRSRSSSVLKRLPYSATKRKSRSTSIARGEQSALLTSSSLERRSRSKGKNNKSRSRSGSIIAVSKTVEREPTLQSTSSAEQSMPETMSLDEKQLSISASTVGSFGQIKLPDVSLASVTESKSGSYPSGTSSPVSVMIPCNENSVEMESSAVSAVHNILLDDHMKSTTSKCPTEQIDSPPIPINERPTIECLMDSEQISFTTTQNDCTEHSAEVVNVVELSKEAFEVKTTNDPFQHTKVVDLRIENEQEQMTSGGNEEDGTVCKSFSSSPDFDPLHVLSHLASLASTEYIKSEPAMVVTLDRDLSYSSCPNKPCVEAKPEFAHIGSVSICNTSLKARENSANLKADRMSSDHIAASPDLKLSSTDPLPNCTEKDALMSTSPESIECSKHADTDVPEIKYMSQKGCISSTVLDHSSITVEQDVLELPVENQESLHSSSTIDHITSEGKSNFSPVTSNEELNMIYNKQENNIINSISNENQNIPELGSVSSIVPGSSKPSEEGVSESMLSTPIFKSPTLNEDVIQQSCLKEKPETQCQDESNLSRSSESKEDILEANLSETNIVTQKERSSHDICIPNESHNESASSCVMPRYRLDHSKYKDYVSNDNLKETGQSEVSHPIENKTLEIKPTKENLQTISCEHIREDLSSTCQVKESNNLPVSSPCGMALLNTSQPLEVDKINVHSLSKLEDHEVSMEEKPASESAYRNSAVSPNIDYDELSKSKQSTTLPSSNITNLPARASHGLCPSAKIYDASSEKNPVCMSVTLKNNEMSVSTDSTEERKMESQRHNEVLSNTINTESYADCKVVCKPSPFNDANDGCTKQGVDMLVYGDTAQLESSANRIPSSDHEVICHFEKTSNSREQDSLSVLRIEKPCSSSTIDENIERVQLENQKNALSWKMAERSVSNTEIDEHCFYDCSSQREIVSKRPQSVPMSKDSESECLTNSKDNINLPAVNEDYNRQKKSIESRTSMSWPSLYVQEKVLPKNEDGENLERESSIQSLTKVKKTELEAQKQTAKAPNYSKTEFASSSLSESRPPEDPKMSPKPFLHEAGKLSVTSVPVQFKFSKTFKTLSISQLCSTSEDSSDVELSTVNASPSVVMHNTSVSTTDPPRSSSKTSQKLPIAQTANLSVEPSKSCSPITEFSQDGSMEPSQLDLQSGQLSERDILQPDNLQTSEDSQTGSKRTFPHISNVLTKSGVKQRQYRSRSVAKDSRTPSADRGQPSRSRSKSLSRRHCSDSKSSSRKKRSHSTSRKKSSHSKSDRRKRSRSRSRGRKRRSHSKSKGKKKRSTSKLSEKRKRSRSKSSERIGGSKSLGKQRSSRSMSKTRKNRLSKSPEKKGRSRSKSETRKNLHSKTASTRKRSQSKSPNWRRKSRSKSLSSRSRSRSLSASWKRLSHSKSSLHRKHSHSSSRSASPRRSSRSRNKRRSFSRSPAARSNSRSRSRWHRSRSRGRWRRSRSLSNSRNRSRSTSRLSSSLSAKKRKSLSPVRKRRSRSQIKQKDKSPVSKLKSTSPPPPPPQKKFAQLKSTGFKHSIGLKSLIQKQLSQAKSQGSTGKLSKEQISLPNVTSRLQLSIFSNRTQASVSNLSTIAQMPVPNLAEVPLPSVSAGCQVPMPNVPPAEPLSVSSLAAETQLSVPDLTTANQWHVPDMSSGTPWSVPDIAAGTQWSMTDLAASTQWPVSDLTAGTHWPMHDLSVGAQWSMPDLAAGTQWAVPDVATGAQWAVPDLAAGTQWTVPDLTAGSQWAMTNLTAGAQWAVPDLTATAQWTVPDLTAGAQIQRPDFAPEAQVPGSDLAPEAQVPGSDLSTEAQVPGSDLASEAQVPGSDMVADAQVPLEHELTSEEHSVIPDVAAEALVPVASSTIVPDVAAGIPLPDVAADAQMPVPDVAATVHMPDVATEAQRQMSDFVVTQAYMSLSPEVSMEGANFGEPNVASEHQIESDSCDDSAQQSSFEPNVNTSQNLQMKEASSSVQLFPLDCFANSQSTDLNDKAISLDKQDLLLNKDPVTDLLINLSQVERGMDSECHLSSESCRSSDVPSASCESSDYPKTTLTISSPVHSISVEANATQEPSLTDCHRSPDNCLQFEPLASSQCCPNQTGGVDTNDDRDQRLLTVTNSTTDCNLEVQSNNSSDNTLIEEQCSKSDCSTWIAPYASPENLLLEEPSVNSNIMLDINSDRISDLNKLEVCTPSHSPQVKLNPSLSLPHPTEPFSSPERPRLVEPYASPDHPQLVEPYSSPVHPQLVEPYSSPQHPPFVELYSSPDRPQLVEPYASPDFPQLVEPYASPDRQQLGEPYTDTEHTQTCQPCISPVLTENTCSPTETSLENSEVCSNSGQTLTYPTDVTYHTPLVCTQTNVDIVLPDKPDMNTSSSCADGSKVKDFSQLHEYSLTSDVPKKQNEIVNSDYPQFSKLNNASGSLQEVPSPTLLNASNKLESNVSPNETTAEECSPIEWQSVETSTGSSLEHSTSSAQLLSKSVCSPHSVHLDESFPITDCKPLTSPEPKVDQSCATTNLQLLGVQCVRDELLHSEELCPIKEVFQPHKDCNSSEQEQSDKLYNMPVQPQEDFPSPSISPTNKQSLNAAHTPFTEYELVSTEDPINHPDRILNIPVLPILEKTSADVINLHGGDLPCAIMPLPDKPEQETVTEHAHSEESKVSVFPDKLLTTRIDKPLDKPPRSGRVVLDDDQDSCCSSSSKHLPDYPSSFLPEHSCNEDQSTPTDSSTQINQSLLEGHNHDHAPTYITEHDQPILKTDESLNTSAFQSPELSLHRYIDDPLHTENVLCPTSVPCLNQDKVQCLISNQASDMSECMKQKTEDSDECIKIDNPYTTTPPDLLPYDSDQPTDICSEPLSEPVPFNSQPPPELLPYDSEQPANPFLSISEYSTEQGSSVFHAPPELLPYDSDQPTVLHNQQTEPTGEPPVYDSTTIHETHNALDLPSMDSVENSGGNARLDIHVIPEKYVNTTVNPQLSFVTEVTSECSIVENSSKEHTFTSEILQEYSVPSAVVDCTQEYQSSSWSSTDEHHPSQQLAENDQPVVQPVLGSEVPVHVISRGEDQTEQIPPLTNISDTSEVQCSSAYELVNPSESDTTRVLPLVQEEISLETAETHSPSKSSTNSECLQSKPVSSETDPISESKSIREYSRSRSKDREKSRSKSASKSERSRSKSVTRTKSLLRSRKTKSRSASSESNRVSPSVVNRKESTCVVHKRSSSSTSVERRKRSRSSSKSPRKRSNSSVSRKGQKRSSPSKSHQRNSRSPNEFRKLSRSPSISSRRRSSSVTRKRRSASATRKKRSPSSGTRRRRTPSPAVTRRRRSPSATRRRRSPSATRRRRSPSATRRRRSPSATRRRRSPSATRRRRSPSATRRRRSPSATRRRRSPSATRRRLSPSATRRRRSPSATRWRRSPSATRWRRSRTPSAPRRRRSPSPSSTRRRLSPSPSATGRRCSPSPSATRRRLSPSPLTSRRPSPTEFRRKRSPSLSASRKRNSRSPSIPRKRRSRSTSASRRRRSRSASQRKRSRSPSAPRKRSKSKSQSKSPKGKPTKSDRSRSLSHTETSRKRKTQSRSLSRGKNTDEKKRKRSSSKDSSKDYYSVKQRRKSRTPPRRKKSRSPGRRASLCKSPVRRRRSRSPIRRKSFSRSPIRRKRSRSRDLSMDSLRSPKRLTDLDKAQLLEIAKANAAAMCAKAGVPLPLSLKPAMTAATPAEDKITHRTYGGTIQELTEKCKQIAQSKEDDVIVNKPHDSDDEEEDRPFYNHPFKVSEHKPISFSLLNPTLKPALKNQVTLTKEFPVSSGSQHRKKESDKVYGEWVPVDKKTEESKDDVFTNTGPSQPVDITSAMNERAVAQTRLTGNPHDIEALYMLNRVQEQIDAWAQSSSIPGQFTGSTGAQVLSAEEISGPQAWLRKDQFLKAVPVTGGRGALLMRKMGWKEGEGLGRNNEGNVDPILLDFKTDRKGLVADGEKASNKRALPVMKDLSGKHPISALMELCNKKKWSPPEFELVDDTGPEHRKRFLFRVTVNGVLCQPCQPSVTKKLAKATAAAAALQALGALPKENITSTSNFCSASTSML